MSESTFSKRLRDEMTIGGLFSYRIESAISPGLPDIHYTTIWDRPFVSGWIETKDCKTMPRKVPYRPHQPGWLTKYAKDGGNCLTIMFISSTREIVVIDGQYSKQAAVDLRSTPHKVFNTKDKNGWQHVVAYILFLNVPPTGSKK